MKTLGSQWARITIELEALAAFQQRTTREQQDSAEATLLNVKGLSILDYALNQAKVQHRKARFAFWKSPILATSQLELMHLLGIKQELEQAQAVDGVSREGEYAALKLGIDQMLHRLTVTDSQGKRTFLPGYSD